MSLHRIRIVIRRHLYVLWRAPHRWFDIAFWPLMDVILWGSLGIAKVLAALGVVSITAYAFFGFDTTPVGWSLVPISLILVIVGWGLGIAGIGFTFSWPMLRSFRHRSFITRSS